MSLKRRRTEIREIESKPAKLVAFSKRRKGLFNKAKEIGTLCGARVGIVVFSPAGKPYLVGDDVIDEFRTEPGMGTEFLDVVNWVESALGGCRTVDDLESLIRDYESLHQMVEHRLKGSLTVASSGGAFLGSCPCPSPSSLIERPDGLGCQVVGLLAAPNLISETENPPLDVMEGRAVAGDPLVPPGTENLSRNSWDNMVGGVRGTDLSLESAGSSMMEAEVAANWGGAFLGPCPSSLLDRSDVDDYRVVGLQAALNPITETEYPLLLDSEERLPNLIDVMEGYNSSDDIGGGPGTDLSPDSVSSSMMGAEVATNWGGAFLGPCLSSTLLDGPDGISYQVDGFQAAPNPISETEYPLLLEMEEQLLHDMPDGTRSSSDNIEGGTGTDLSPDTAGLGMTEAEIDAWVNSLLSGN